MSSSTQPPFATFTERLASFDDRLTMRHTRTFPQPVELVWQAITETNHLNHWLIRSSTVEPRRGGRCAFTWGGETEQVGTVSVFDPPRTVCYDLGTSFLRFELTPVDGGTRLVLLHHFSPGAHLEPQDWPNSDQPAGPASPWRPGFSMGFHHMLDVLGLYVDGLAHPNPQATTGMRPGEDLDAWNTRTGADKPEVHEPLVEAYRRHIRESLS